MKEEGFIPKHLELKPEEDFKFLRKKGIEYAQELSGEQWTDYNEHDPGVTILEQLVYALTELGYRSNMDIKDLLASQERLDLTRREGDREYHTSFYTALDIFPTNPITKIDYRKMLIDRVTGLNNAWIIPLNQLKIEDGLKGLYIVLIELSSELKSKEDEERVRREVMENLNYHSNLGEAFEDVVVLKKQEIYLRCGIELEKDANAEKIHAEVIFELEHYISRSIRFYTLNEMLDKGIDVEDVFNGPRLFNGFILDHDLRKKDTVFYNMELLNIIRSVEGIKSVKYLNLLLEETGKGGKVTYKDYYDRLAQSEVTDAIIIEKDKVATLGHKIIENANNPNFFSYYKEDVEVNLFQREVDRNYKALKAGIRLRYGKNMNQANDLPIPTGEKKDIEEYSSIQNHFPELYGLSKTGLPPNLSKQRKTYVYQLKGYLILFEQIIAGYLTQLSRFNELFSLDKQLDQTYFTQVPWDIPGIYKLISQIDAGAKKSELRELFSDAVNKLNQGIEDFYDRRHRFLNHLMARVGDDGYEYPFEKFNYYSKPEEHKQRILNNKIALLQNFPFVSRNKSRSFDPLSPYWGTDNISMLESRVRLKIGLAPKVSKLAHELEPLVSFDGRKIHLSLQSIIDEYKEVTINGLETPLQGLWMKREFEQEKDLKYIENIELDEFIFRRGFWETNLRVVESPLPHEEGFFLLFRKKSEPDDIKEEDLKEFQHIIDFFVTQKNQNQFRILLRHDNKSIYAVEFDRSADGEFLPSPKVIWKVLGCFKDEDTAFKAAYSLRNNLIEWNRKSEGFYMVDHIMLRPVFEENTYVVVFSDESGRMAFELTLGFTIQNIQDAISKEVEAIRVGELKVEEDNEKFRVVAKNSEKTIGYSQKWFDDKVDAEAEMSSLKNYFRNFTDFDVQNTQKVRINRNGMKMQKKAVDYNFTVSVVLTGWTARFSDPEFRYQLENIFRKNTPAHVAIQFIWMTFPQMLGFERDFDQWLTNGRERKDIDELNKASEKVLQYLKGTSMVNTMEEWRSSTMDKGETDQ